MENNKFDRIKTAWDTWANCLNGDDQNSIFKQINFMLWDSAIFGLLLECRHSKLKWYPDRPPINAQFFSFLGRNYFDTQAAAIRRLTDSSSGLMGDKSIYSLSAIIKNLQKMRPELTRTIFFRLRELPLDLPDAKEIYSKLSRTEMGFRIPPEFNSSRVSEAHKGFDRLCGINQKNETRITSSPNTYCSSQRKVGNVQGYQNLCG